jgi:hypothetical protein
MPRPPAAPLRRRAPRVPSRAGCKPAAACLRQPPPRLHENQCELLTRIILHRANTDNPERPSGAISAFFTVALLFTPARASLGPGAGRSARYVRSRRRLSSAYGTEGPFSATDHHAAVLQARAKAGGHPTRKTSGRRRLGQPVRFLYEYLLGRICS